MRRVYPAEPNGDDSGDAIYPNGKTIHNAVKGVNGLGVRGEKPLVTYLASERKPLDVNPCLFAQKRDTGTKRKLSVLQKIAHVSQRALLDKSDKGPYHGRA